MARRLRIESPRALYHVINRGNYRQDVFASAGACHASEQTLLKTCDRFGWRLHAQVVMRNHDHLALQTPAPTLAAGVHWLQGTFATRFKRFRSDQGHLFPGRYRVILVENESVLASVADHIHLNPV